LAGFFSWIVNKIRYARFALSSRTKMLTFGAIYYGNYSNYKNDPTPLIWIQYSGPKHTHAINIHYLNYGDKAWLASTIYMMKRAGQAMDGRVFYNLMKQRRPSMVKTAYRVYFTSLLNVRLVSAGITPLDKMVYTNFSDPWITALNEKIKPSSVANEIIPVAYSPTELRDRIVQAQNSVNIQQSKVVSRPSPFGTAPYIRK